MKKITVLKWDAKKQKQDNKEYPVIDWHYCKDELPEDSDWYLISRLGVWSKGVDEPHIFYDEELRQVEVALFVVDVGMFDTKNPKSVYAWAELPDPAEY